MTQPDPSTDDRRRRFLLEILPAVSVGAEIGVHLGDFSQAILDITEPTHLHLIDPWKHEPSSTYERAWYGGQADRGQEEMDDRYAGVLDRFDHEIGAGRVTVHRGQSGEVLRTLPDDSLDWVYIDGNHLYEFVANDLRLSLAKVKPGGLVTGDDYAEGGWWEGGVKRAVDELAAQGAAQLVLVENGQYVFKKSGA
ncbi:MAG: class I SAM-dependent methyltransferase [Acidimicrobiales bacterium]